MIDETSMLSLVAGLMVLVILIGGLARRRMRSGEAVRLGAIWVAIIAGATILLTIVGRWIG